MVKCMLKSIVAHTHTSCSCFPMLLKVGVFAKRLHITGLMREAPKLSLPGKLVFPRYVKPNFKLRNN